MTFVEVAGAGAAVDAEHSERVAVVLVVDAAMYDVPISVELAAQH